MTVNPSENHSDLMSSERNRIAVWACLFTQFIASACARAFAVINLLNFALLSDAPACPATATCLLLLS